MDDLPSAQSKSVPVPQPPLAGGTMFGGKEREAAGLSDVAIEIPREPEPGLSAEIKEAGVEFRPTTVELPPDLKKLGVQPGGAGQPVIHQAGAISTTVTVSLSDPQIVAGLHAHILSSLRWLAQWCQRQLNRARIRLRVERGTVTRVQIKE